MDSMDLDLRGMQKNCVCRKLILKGLFRFNGTSKPLLTIALKIFKTIEKPLIPKHIFQTFWEIY